MAPGCTLASYSLSLKHHGISWIVTSPILVLTSGYLALFSTEKGF